MKKTIELFGLITLILISGCSKISNKSVIEPLDTKELSESIKNDTSFANFYEIIRNQIDTMNNIQKAKYGDITYSRLFKYNKFLSDTNYWNPIDKQSELDWQTKFGHCSAQADSTINFWRNYLMKNSLNQYIKIELVDIQKEYYSYIGEIRQVNLGFRMTPLKGTVQQVIFKYKYKAKIINGDYNYKTHRCLNTDPIISSQVGYWEVDFLEKDNFGGENIKSFLKNYDFFIEVVEIRKDNINISFSNDIPFEVQNYLTEENNAKVISDVYKDILIKNLINKNYISKLEFIIEERKKIMKNKDERCYRFVINE